MTVLTSLARALAVDRGRAQPIATVRHIHVSHRPLVFVPLAMAGEAHAPMAAMFGADRSRPQLFVVAQPRNREQRYEFAHRLARTLTFEIGSTAPLPRKPDAGFHCADAPQIWIPNRTGVEFVRMLGRATRLRRTTGPGAVPRAVRDMGRWLTFYADRAQYPSSSLLMAATTALCQHWATGQSAAEDEHLGTVLAWITPGEAVSGANAAELMENPVKHPPAGPATDPTFDNTELAPRIRRYHETVNRPAQRALAEAAIETALRGQLIGTWHQMWQAIDLLADMDVGNHVAYRWVADLTEFTRTAVWIRDSDATQPRRDPAVDAARRLHDLERDHIRFTAERAFDDPLVMAEARMVGEAFCGTVTAAEPLRRIGRSKVPHITIETADPVALAEGERGLRSSFNFKQKTELVSRTETPTGVLIELELTEGMGRRTEPEPGTVPQVGQNICYSLFNKDYQRRLVLPDRADTPWTHGGPPTPYMPADGDAREEWE